MVKHQKVSKYYEILVSVSIPKLTFCKSVIVIIHKFRGPADTSQYSEAFPKKLFCKYAANLQLNIHAHVMPLPPHLYAKQIYKLFKFFMFAFQERQKRFFSFLEQLKCKFFHTHQPWWRLPETLTLAMNFWFFYF